MRMHKPPLERLSVFAAASRPRHTGFLTVEKQPGSEGSLLPEQPQACLAASVAHPAGCPPSCPLDDANTQPLCQQHARCC